MKKTTLLNSELSAVIARMGHTDSLVIGDCGLPVPPEVQRIDLAVTKGLPGFYPVLEAILSELCVEKVCVARELQETSPEEFEKMKAHFPDTQIEVVAHKEFKQRTHQAKAVVRTGECISFINVILYSGATF